MAYTALYRKFRPETFADVKGQDAIVKTLANQIQSKRIGHAYLFCGTRGTGKTTIAKILARAINCENPTEYGPCGECAACRAILDGSSMNVIEIDAASNNGVDNIREIRDEVSYSPTDGGYKVYIIDEVHMLSPSAFNALLKTLEEPPAYVVFILATTEPHKLPQTILSRCQRYDFRLISVDTIAGRLRELVDKEGIPAEEKALRYVAKAADGSMRDAISLLDQCIAFYMHEPVTYEHVLDALGAVDTAVFARFYEELTQGNVEGCLTILDEILTRGRDLNQFINDLIWYMRNVMLIASTGGQGNLPGIGEENLEELRQAAALVPADRTMRYIRVLSELYNQLRYSTQKRITAEVAIIKLCKPQMEADTESLLRRIEELEKKVEEGAGQPRVIEKVVRLREGEQAETPRKKIELPAAIPEDVKKAAAEFRQIIRQSNNGMWQSCCANVRLSVSQAGNLLMVFPNGDAGYYYFDRHKEDLERFISGKIEKQLHIELSELPGGRQFDDVFADLEDKIRMPIVVEED